jgi:xanthine phosphoribosyltransferase
MSHRYPVNWKEFYRDAQALAWRLKEMHSWKGIVAITRGGLVPSAIMARELGIRKIDTISIVSYGEDEKQIEPLILKSCQVEEGGAGWLVVDDLVDTGLTAKIVRKMLPHAHITAIYAKPLGKSYVDTFMTEVSQDTWIIFPWEENEQEG